LFKKEVRQYNIMCWCCRVDY